MERILTFLLLCYCSQAAIITPATLDFLDVSNAQASASSGDIISLPAGNAIWGKKLPSVVGKNISYVGQGTNATIITVTAATGPIFQQTDLPGVSLVFSNFTIDCSNNFQAIYLKNTGGAFLTNLHITRMLFTRNYSRCVEVEGYIYGLIDHCTFLENGGTELTIYGDPPGVAPAGGATAWTRPVVFSTRDALFVEDNIFVYTATQTRSPSHSVAANHGGRYVFRHNSVTSARAAFPDVIDAHGYWEYGRGTVSAEIYKNVIASDVGGTLRAMHIRGGSSVICSNTMTGADSMGIVLNDYRAFETPLTYPDDYPSQDQVSNTWVWQNTWNAGAMNATVNSASPVPQFIVAGRDFSNAVLSGWSPFTYPHPMSYVPYDPSTNAQVKTASRFNAHILRVK